MNFLGVPHDSPTGSYGCRLANTTCKTLGCSVAQLGRVNGIAALVPFISIDTIAFTLTVLLPLPARVGGQEGPRCAPNDRNDDGEANEPIERVAGEVNQLHVAESHRVRPVKPTVGATVLLKKCA